MRAFITSIAILFSLQSHAQDIRYAQAVLDSLCSEHFDGRGFYNNGEKRAAAFIKNEYEKFGLKPFKGSYFQSFTHPVNAITGDIVVEVDGETLAPGKDFLIHPSSPKTKISSKLMFLTQEELTDIEKFKRALGKSAGKFLVIDQSLIKDASKAIKGQVYEITQFLKFAPNLPLNGVIEVVEGKLTHTASQQLAARPHLIILNEKLPSTTKKMSINIENTFVENYRSQNVIGYLEGREKDRFMVITGHYDHLGRMGDKVYFPGANDNASGIAMLLGLAKALAKEDLNYSIVFMAFGAEEIGLVGSRYYTENPLFPLSQIKFMINLDILGTGDDGIQVVNGKEFRTEFDQLVSLNEENSYLKQVKIRGKACNSDHCFFHEKGVPSFYIYTLGGVAHYHDIYDKSETLPLTEYEDLFRLLKDFIVKQE